MQCVHPVGFPAPADRAAITKAVVRLRLRHGCVRVVPPRWTGRHRPDNDGATIICHHPVPVRAGPEDAARAVVNGGRNSGESVSNPYQTPPPDPYGGQTGQPWTPPPGYGPQPGYSQAPPGYGYPTPQQVPYGMAPTSQGMPFAPAVQPNNLATASVVLGFLSVLICFYGGLLGPVGLGLGIAGVNRARTTGVGRSAAVGGIVLSVLSILISIAALVFFVVLDQQSPA